MQKLEEVLSLKLPNELSLKSTNQTAPNPAFAFRFGGRGAPCVVRLRKGGSVLLEMMARILRPKRRKDLKTKPLIFGATCCKKHQSQSQSLPDCRRILNLSADLPILLLALKQEAKDSCPSSNKEAQIEGCHAQDLRTAQFVFA